MIIVKRTVRKLLDGLGLRPSQIRRLISKTGLYPYFAPATKKFSFKERRIADFTVQKAWKEWIRIDRKRLNFLKDIHKDKKRCFIIGNGPSLNKLDLSLLKNEITFGVNNIFLNFDKMRFKPTYYLVEDILVAEERAREINELTGMVKLFPLYLSYCLKRDKDTTYLNHGSFQCCLPDERRVFPLDLSEYSCGGFTVLYTCLQLAFYMGFKKVYLIGTDFSYRLLDKFKRQVQYNKIIITSESDDPNHFHSDYFGKGYRWYHPNLEEMAKSFKEAKRAYELYDRQIYNATAGGKLEIFKRIDYNSLFK